MTNLYLKNLMNKQMSLNHLLNTLEHVYLMVDSIDTGFTNSTQKKLISERQNTIKEFRKMLIGRYKELSKILNQDSATKK